MAKLSDFMISRVRVKLLKLLLEQPGQMYYVRELTRLSSEEINAVRRELGRLKDKGIAKSEHRGNRLYYQASPDYLFYPELLRLVVKSSGLGQAIIKNKSKLGFVKYAFISTGFIKGREKSPDQVDLMIVGKVILPQLNILIQGHETKTKRELNYSIMAEEEFNYRKSRRDPFVISVIAQSKIMLIGDEERLLG